MNTASQVVVDLSEDDGYQNIPLGIGLTCGLLVLVAIVAVVIRRRGSERTAAVAEMASRLGFEVASPDAPPLAGFEFMSVGSSQFRYNQVWRTGESTRIFDYRYLQGSGEQTSTSLHTAVMVPLPFRAPGLQIGPEGFWSKLGRVSGRRGIEIGTRDFDDTFHVTGDDEEFARALLDEDTVSWITRHAASHGRTIRFEFAGPWLLCIEKQLDVDQWVGFLEWANEVPGRLPPALASKYPLTDR